MFTVAIYADGASVPGAEAFSATGVVPAVPGPYLVKVCFGSTVIDLRPAPPHRQ